MAIIKFNNVSLNFPIFGSNAKSFRSHVIRMATGGMIERDSRTTYITALDSASFEINDGDAVGLIGHNGAGKSTLLRAMAGIYVPSSGRIDLKGRVSTVFELGAGLEYELSGYENIYQLGMLMGWQRTEIKEILVEVEEFSELGEFLNFPIRTYSSGMIMRLMFSVATAVTPEILLLDEMISTGDESFRKKSEKRITEIIEKSKILVLASHDKYHLRKYCNRLFRLDRGLIEEIGIETIT